VDRSEKAVRSEGSNREGELRLTRGKRWRKASRRCYHEEKGEESRPGIGGDKVFLAQKENTPTAGYLGERRTIWWGNDESINSKAPKKGECVLRDRVGRKGTSWGGTM